MQSPCGLYMQGFMGGMGIILMQTSSFSKDGKTPHYEPFLCNEEARSKIKNSSTRYVAKTLEFTRKFVRLYKKKFVTELSESHDEAYVKQMTEMQNLPSIMLLLPLAGNLVHDKECKEESAL